MLDKTKVLPEDEIESARILMNEGLVEEAKKTLYRVLARKPELRGAHELLKKIEAIELKELFSESPTDPSQKAKTTNEDINGVIDQLDRDLSLGLNEASDAIAKKEIWNALSDSQAGELDAKARYDLGVAFYEMGCFLDALRELQRAEKRIRMENTFLDETGLAVVTLSAQCLIDLGRAFEAKAYLEPVLTEPDLKHEDKLGLYYAMALAEQSLGNTKNALNWYLNISGTDPDFRDVQLKMRAFGR